MKHVTGNIKKNLFLRVMLSGVMGYMLHASNVHAQQSIQMTVVPPRQELSVKPGETTRIQVKYYNKSDEPISGYIKKADFLVLDNQGTPTLFDIASTNNRFAASTWLTPSENRVTIAANDQYLATITIKVPADAYPCGRYTSIYFEPVTPSLGGQTVNIESASSVAFRLASLIYINVDGQCRESAYVSKISTPQFLEYGPVPVDVEILNRSDYHISPHVSLTLNNLLGNPSDVSVLPLLNIFPDTPRAYKVELGSKWMIGRYKIVLNGGYGKTGQTLSAVTYIWVFPWRVALLIILTLIVLYLLIKTIMDRMNKKTVVLEKEIEEEKEEIDELRQALKKRRD
jgi:hypothetical protein